ncbi:DUF302 domain-containing protein [Sulfurirhabdus autotrophica]|uniref:Uncharacterized protein (DUF302 family) n=1 Tax=Sulfurirhabdus autotrophica TaxID=1706046 RepID=A0A4V2W310_9PROT|nr:DUF302 domain-containing protein [Sulfurirhabdus autotrophica]TCV90139.1 uncharacterized protein (DUF302 family) [Sulfurirhabdus autotrophica]
MKVVFALALLIFSHTAFSATSNVYEKSVSKDMEATYQNVYKALEDNGFYVIFEPNIGKNLEKFSAKWGKEYNQNKLESIRSMVFCSAWYANQISNSDPSLLALCPLHITLTHKSGQTTILFIKPSVVAKGSAAEKIAKELENDVIKSLESGLNAN